MFALGETMSEEKKCLKCGKPLPVDATEPGCSFVCNGLLFQEFLNGKYLDQEEIEAVNETLLRNGIIKGVDAQGRYIRS